MGGTWDKTCKVSFKEIFERVEEEDKRYPNLDMLINMCFKFNIDTKAIDFDRFRSLNNYYRWLLDMKDFDYSLFDPKWVSYYGSKHYFEEMSKHEIIRVKIKQYLKSQIDPQLERDFITLSTKD